MSWLLQKFLKYTLWTRTFNITSEIVRNAHSWALSQLPKSETYALQVILSLRTTGLEKKTKEFLAMSSTESQLFQLFSKQSLPTYVTTKGTEKE